MEVNNRKSNSKQTNYIKKVLHLKMKESEFIKVVQEMFGDNISSISIPRNKTIIWNNLCVKLNLKKSKINHFRLYKMWRKLLGGGEKKNHIENSNFGNSELKTQCSPTNVTVNDHDQQSVSFHNNQADEDNLDIEVSDASFHDKLLQVQQSNVANTEEIFENELQSSVDTSQKQSDDYDNQVINEVFEINAWDAESCNKIVELTNESTFDVEDSDDFEENNMVPQIKQRNSIDHGTIGNIGRKSLVGVSEAVTVIERFIDSFKDGNYPKYSSEIWKKISNSLNNKWSANNVFTNVTQNRRNIMEFACTNQKIIFTPFVSRKKAIEDISNLNSSNDNNDSSYEFETNSSDLQEFQIRITRDEWKQMQVTDITYSDNRTYSTLCKNVWTDILGLAIDRQLELPCAFSFKNLKIYSNSDSRYYMRIRGYCKSIICGNRIYCYLDKDPGDKDFDVLVKTGDTFNANHEQVERQLRGLRRQRVGEEVCNEGCVNWYKRQARETTKFGGRIPSHIPSLNTLRHAKKEHVDNKLNIKASDGKDLVNTIENMNYAGPYSGFIHEVRRRKFYCSFSTPQQLHAYKQYYRTNKSMSSVSIDGTGSIIKPLAREDGSVSGHIFLYSVVINFNGITLSVYDMLTESQDTDVILWWLRKWQKLCNKLPKPREAVCDYSRALLNAICNAFNDMTIKAYVDNRFLYAIGSPEYVYQLPVYTYVRLDVAHLMIMIRKWDCFKHMRHTKVRQFYQYCFGLMIDCQTLNQFKEIFQLMCIVGANEFENSIIKETGESVLFARRKLETYISNRKFDVDFEEGVFVSEFEYTSNDDGNTNSTGQSRIRNWINNLRTTASVRSQEGSEINSFYFIDFIDRLMPLAFEFPLWTAVCIPHVAQHALTTFVEGHFNIIKNIMLQKYPGRLRVDKFLKLILDDYLGTAAVFTSKLKANIKNNDSYPSPSLKNVKVFLPRKANIDEIAQLSDIKLSLGNSLECFSTGTDILKQKVNSAVNLVNDEKTKKNQEIVIRKPKGKYFKCNPNIEYRNALPSNIQKAWLIKNGNLINSPTTINGIQYFASNTCGFDSIMQILAAFAMDEPRYMQYIDASQNQALKFVHFFVKNGASAKTYSERILLLKDNFEDKISSTLKWYTINIYDSIINIWNKCFKSEPSGWYTHECQNCKKFTSDILVLQVNFTVILERGFSALQEAICNDVSRWQLCTNKCLNYCQTTLCTYNNQIFIELDIRNTNSTAGLSGTLDDFPCKLDLGGHQYRLAGIIGYVPGHYIAYCRRMNNHWEMCNNLNLKIENVQSNKKVEPHAVVYIKEFSIIGEISIEDQFPGVLPILGDPDVNSRDNWRNKEKLYNIHVCDDC